MLFGLLVLILAAASAQATTPTWTTCPPDQMGAPGFFCASGNSPTCEWKCATLKFPLDRGNPSGPTVDSFVRRIAPITGPTKTTMWGFPGGNNLIYNI